MYVHIIHGFIKWFLPKLKSIESCMFVLPAKNNFKFTLPIKILVLTLLNVTDFGFNVLLEILLKIKYFL